MSTHPNIPIGYENLSLLIKYIQTELSEFKGFEISIISIMLRFYLFNEEFCRINLKDIAHLAQVRPDNSQRLLRIMAEKGLISFKLGASGLVEVGLTKDGRNLVDRLISGGV